MFDKLIESEPAGADFRDRRSYFITSSVVVGILFVTAVVISIYAADIGLGNNGFELVELVQPLDLAAVEPEPIRQRPTTAPSHSEVPTRLANIPRIDESPIVPATISVVRNTQMTRPYTEFIISTRESGPADPGTSGRDLSGSNTNQTGLSTTQPEESVKIPEPPPVRKEPVADKKPVIQSLGVINGKAEYLPKPIYSAAALAIHADGKVDVQVLIDENGRVISAKAVSGHILLRPAAEMAARNAKFTTTYLSKVPVKVSGVIVYNFTH